MKPHAGGASRVVGKAVRSSLIGIEREVGARAYRASNELKNASLHVLRGHRSGRSYRVPYTRRTYRASAPGEPPATRTGAFRMSWAANVTVARAGGRFTATSSIESGRRAESGRGAGGGGAGPLLGEMLERGSPRMAPRPYKQAIRERAMPAIRRLYGQPYKI